MRARLIQLCSAALFAGTLMALPVAARASDDGIIRVESSYSMEETIERLKKDIVGKGIKFFSEIDQSKLAADAGIKLRPSVLLIFGNPPLGTQFITANANAGLDWPVRLLVFQDESGVVWAAYTDFAWIAQRHQIKDREAVFNKAASMGSSEVTMRLISECASFCPCAAFRSRRAAPW